jgi:glycosyltransferase involved in cell wall biosynthesis
MNPPPTVALVDTRWAGHHPTYLREFSASLLRMGARVLLLCQKPDEILEALDEAPSDRIAGFPFIHRNHGVINRNRDHDPLSTPLRWRATAEILDRAERDTGWTADLVFFCYLDCYLRFSPFPLLPGMTLGRPWSGLYFRNGHLEFPGDPLRRAAKGDRLLRSHDCRAVCTLDERFNDTLEEISGHPAIAFPDMTDETLPDTPTPAARALRKKAGGRKIIGLISMEKRKGLVTMLKAALRAGELREPWYFVATGPYPRGTFSPEDLAFLDDLEKRIAAGEIDHIHFDTSGDRIQDGAPYNSIFSTFDLVWAAYEGFEGSSNALTKAAAFRIPLVATAGQCVGSRVERFELGRTFPEGDPEAAVEAIRGALDHTAADGSRLDPGFEAYHRGHSRQRLDEVFRALAFDATPQAIKKIV